jgi:hypothetical protein
MLYIPPYDNIGAVTSKKSPGFDFPDYPLAIALSLF